MPGTKYCDQNNQPNLKTEEMLRDFIVGVICADTNKDPEKSYAAWEPSHSLTKNDTFLPLDKVMTDECVHQVIVNYFLDDDYNDKGIYKLMKEADLLDGLYTRRVSNGRFSKYAVQKLGYPDDSIKQENKID